MRILLLCRYGRLGASSRLRSLQFMPYLETQGLQVTVAPLLDDKYVANFYKGKTSPASVVRGYFGRLRSVLTSTQFDLLWVEKELLPWTPPWIELGLIPKRARMVVDYDDAVFHRYDLHNNALVRALLRQKIDAVMRRADLVMVGNEYLAARARAAGARRVEWIPTVVDTDRYRVEPSKACETITIGWIGTGFTSAYLGPIQSVLKDLVASRRVRFVAIGANPQHLSDPSFVFKPWHEDTEVAAIQQIDIGVMPLPDEPFERGKCGYKLIQYMACGKPVVASPVGVNSQIVRNEINGFLANTPEEWAAALVRLCDDSALRTRMGLAGRRLVETTYSCQVVAPKIEALFRSVVMEKDDSCAG
jgi:glycosyltransferase involved in cell wall biosynthesis